MGSNNTLSNVFPSKQHADWAACVCAPAYQFVRYGDRPKQDMPGDPPFSMVDITKDEGPTPMLDGKAIKYAFQFSVEGEKDVDLTDYTAELLIKRSAEHKRNHPTMCPGSYRLSVWYVQKMGVICVCVRVCDCDYDCVRVLVRVRVRVRVFASAFAGAFASASACACARACACACVCMCFEKCVGVWTLLQV